MADLRDSQSYKQPNLFGEDYEAPIQYPKPATRLNLRDSQSHKDSNLFGEACQAPIQYPEFITRDETLDLGGVCQHDRGGSFLTCKDRKRDVFISEVDGLGLDDIKIRGINVSLPHFIPVVPPGLLNWEVGGNHRFLILQLKDVFPEKQSGSIEYILNKPIFRGKKIILTISSTPDYLLEKLVVLIALKLNF